MKKISNCYLSFSELIEFQNNYATRQFVLFLLIIPLILQVSNRADWRNSLLNGERFDGEIFGDLSVSPPETDSSTLHFNPRGSLFLVDSLFTNSTPPSKPCFGTERGEK